MSAPANDPFASATVITGLTGSITGTNILASTETIGGVPEAGWPTYNPAPIHPKVNAIIGPQATVWYSWTCPAFPTPTKSGFTYTAPPTGEVYFSVLIANFRSVVQIYTAFNAEVPYVLDERVGLNNGMGNGASASFVATVGTPYYIRVGGRQTDQGNFTLSWKPFDRPTLGSCTQCGPTSQGVQVGSLTVPNVATDSTQSFPSVGAGLYKISWCKGVAIVDHNEPYWALSAGTVLPGFSQTIILTWPEGTWTPMPMGAPATYNSQTEAEIANACMSTGPFISCGGTFTMAYQDFLLTDNIPGTANPTFQLVNITNTFAVDNFQTNLGATSLSGTSPSWTCDFGITSIIPETITSITATLLNINGITDASAAQTITIVGSSAGNSVTFTFDADLGASFCTAVIELSACGAVFATLEYPLFPTIVVSLGTTDGGGFGCSPSAFNAFFSVKITNPIVSMADLGISGVVLTGTCSPIQLETSDSHCTNETSEVSPALGIGTHTDVLIMVVKSQGTTTNNNYTVAVDCASLAYPNFTVTIPVP